MIILKSLIFLLLMLLSSAGWGRLVLKPIRARYCRQGLPEIIYPALGFGIISYLSLIAGFADFFNLLTLSLIYLIGLIAVIPALFDYIRRIGVAIRDFGRASLLQKSLFLLLFFVLAVIFIKTLAPPANINDSLAYHLNCPKLFLEAGRVFIIPYDIDCATPFFMEMLFSFGVALGEPIFAKLISYLMGVLLLFAIIDFSKRYICVRYSILAGLIFALTQAVYVHMSYAYVELGLALYLFISFYMFYEWLRRNETIYLALSAIFIGFAFSIKVLAGFLFLPLCLYIILRAVKRQEGLEALAKYLLLFGSLAGIFSFIWYLRSYLIFGNPVFPYMGTLFTGRFAGQIGDLAHHGFGRSTGLFSLLRLPWDLTFHPELFGLARIGPIYLGILPLALIALRQRGFLRLGFFIFIYLLCWFYTCQYTRYLIAILPLCSLAVVYLIAAVDSRPWRQVKTGLFLFISLFLLLQTGALIYNTRSNIRVAFGIETAQDYLNREERTYSIARYINENLPTDARILVSEVRLFYFDREVVREDTLRLFTGYDKKGYGKRELLDLLKKEGFSHILCNRDPRQYRLPLRLILEQEATPIHIDKEYTLYRIQ